LVAASATAAALIGTELLGGEIVTSAIAHAPNSNMTLRVDGTHPPPVPPDAEEFVVRVGPPEASLDAWSLSPPGGTSHQGTVVLLHGIRGDKSSLLGFARRFRDAGYRAVMPDLRGHGSSSGDFLTYGVVESKDVSQLVDAIAARFGEKRVVLFGYSYGGAVAIQAAARDSRIEAVVAVATFASLRQVVSDYKTRFFPALDPIIPATWLQARLDDAGRRARFDPDAADPARAAAELDVPLLLIHGTSDTQIPPDHARALSRSSSHSSLVLIDGETHDSMLNHAAARIEDEALAFLRKSGRRARP
jgi:pimeloyl-ACP methyl ester carboxylesterase